MSAMAEVSSISENPTSSMRHQALVFGGALASAPRSDPIVRKRLVPNITKAMAKMTSSIFESNMSLLRSEVNLSRPSMIRQRDYDIGLRGIDACSVAFEISGE